MYFKSICSFYFSNYWKGESKQLLWLYKKCLETGHVLKNLYWQPQNCLRPVSHVVKTTCSLLIKTHKKQLLTSIGSCTQLFQSSQVLSTAVLSIKLRTCCTVANCGNCPCRFQTLAFCYLALVPRILLKKQIIYQTRVGCVVFFRLIFS